MKESTIHPYYAKIKKIGEGEILEVELGNRTLPDGFSSKYLFCKENDPNKTACLVIRAGFGFLYSQSKCIELSIHPLTINDGNYPLCPYHEPDKWRQAFVLNKDNLLYPFINFESKRIFIFFICFMLLSFWN